MAAPTEREFRRFTAIAVTHSELRTPGKVASALSSRVLRNFQLPDAPDGWEVSMIEYLASRKHYPDGVGSKSRDRGSAGYAHDLYVASKDFGGSIGPAALIASPYVAILHQVISELTSAVGQPAVQYLGVDMPRVYASLDAAGENAAVNRVTMQVIGEPNADLVTLAGKRPLHSRIHETLEGVTVPYGIGVNVEFSGSRCRVNLDRHGRISWFQTAADRVSHPLELLNRVALEGALLKARRFPLERESRDSLVTSDDL